MKNEEICEEEKCRCWSHKNIRGNDVEVSEELREKPSYFRKRILKPLRKDVGNLKIKHFVNTHLDLPILSERITEEELTSVVPGSMVRAANFPAEQKTFRS